MGPIAGKSSVGTGGQMDPVKTFLMPNIPDIYSPNRSEKWDNFQEDLLIQERTQSSS